MSVRKWVNFMCVCAQVSEICAQVSVWPLQGVMSWFHLFHLIQFTVPPRLGHVVWSLSRLQHGSHCLVWNLGTFENCWTDHEILPKSPGGSSSHDLCSWYTRATGVLCPRPDFSGRAAELDRVWGPNFLNRCCKAFWNIQDMWIHPDSSRFIQIHPDSRCNILSSPFCDLQETLGQWRPSFQALPNCNSLRCWGSASQTWKLPARDGLL